MTPSSWDFEHEADARRFWDAMRARFERFGLETQLHSRMHDAIPEQGTWLMAVVTGYFAFHEVPTNAPALGAFQQSTLNDRAFYSYGGTPA